MPEKKCYNCKHEGFCAMHLGIKDMAHLLTVNRDNDIAGKTGFVSMVNHLAHDCNRFEVLKDE